jgi:hypothetical protein
VLDHPLRLIKIQVKVLADVRLFLMKFIENIKRGQQSAQDPQHQRQRSE